MSSVFPLWWLALPVLLLPIWWHRQKRRQLKSQTLATARFLPPTDPHQRRVWRWSDRILLALRCALLATLLAWLAASALAWRGDSVLVDASVDKAWAERQIAAAGFQSAARLDFCASGCALDATRIVPWLQEHEREWKHDARLLIVAGQAAVPMPAAMPQFAHAVTLRVRPSSAASPETPAPHRIALATTPERADLWRATLAAFDRAGTGKARYAISETPDAQTELIIWDKEGAPPPQWRAPLWWIGSAASVPELAPSPPPSASLSAPSSVTVSLNGIALRYADSARGRLWAVDAPRDADAARALYDSWQALKGAAPAYPAPDTTLPARRSAPSLSPDAAPASWLPLALLALFGLERMVTHARRR